MNLRTLDVLVMIACICFVSVHAITVYLIHAHQDIAVQAGINAKAVELMEVNPFTRWAIFSSNINTLIRFLFGPSLIITIYIFLRRQFTTIPYVVEQFVLTIFFAALLNVTNDLAALFGFMANNGGLT